MRVGRLDSISLDKTYYTEEGYFVDHPIVTTCGIFEYKNTDGSTRRELRLPEYVFDEKSLQSYKGKPIIITHDAGEVNKDNVHREQIGTIMSEGYRDGDSVRCEIIIHDTNALKRCGLKELSLGYSLDTEDVPGVWQGEPYDCIQKNIEINHLALVGEARAGETARLNMDSKDEDYIKGGRVIMYNPDKKGYRADDGEELSPEELEAAIALFKAQKVAENASGEGTDGTAESNSDVGEKNLIEKVRANMERRNAENNEMSTEDMIAEQKEDLEILLAEIDKLQASNDMSVMDGKTSTDSANEEIKDTITEEEDKQKKEKEVNMDSVDQMFKERLDICRMADKLQLDGIETLSVREGKVKIIKAVNPKMNLDGKSDSYISAAYDIAKETFYSRKSTDDQRRQMVEAQVRKDAKEESNSNEARKNMINRMMGGRK